MKMDFFYNAKKEFLQETENNQFILDLIHFCHLNVIFTTYWLTSIEAYWYTFREHMPQAKLNDTKFDLIDKF